MNSESELFLGRGSVESVVNTTDNSINNLSMKDFTVSMRIDMATGAGRKVEELAKRGHNKKEIKKILAEEISELPLGIKRFLAKEIKWRINQMIET